jgi:hypothetical protein
MTILQDKERLIFSSGILRLVGYGLLLMAIVDIFFLLVPPQLMNPLWEFETMGTIIERIPVTLLGMVLIYYGERSDRAPIETLLLKVASWLSLAASLLLLLMIPLSINNAFRIYQQQNAEVNTQFVSQKETIEKYKEQLKVVDSKDEIQNILQQQAQQKIEIPNSINLQELKTDILQKLQKNQDTITNQVNSFKTQKRTLILKKCLRWNLGGLISAILFFLIWKSTGWARIQVNED